MSVLVVFVQFVRVFDHKTIQSCLVQWSAADLPNTHVRRSGAGRSGGSSSGLFRGEFLYNTSQPDVPWVLYGLGLFWIVNETTKASAAHALIPAD